LMTLPSQVLVLMVVFRDFVAVIARTSTNYELAAMGRKLQPGHEIGMSLVMLKRISSE